MSSLKETPSKTYFHPRRLGKTWSKKEERHILYRTSIITWDCCFCIDIDGDKPSMSPADTTISRQTE